MTQKILLYSIVLTLAAALGFLASYQMAGAPPDVAKPVSLQDRAEAMAQKSQANGPSRAAFTMPNLDGSDSSLADWQGQPILINFWATWCAPCRREIPLLKKMQAEQAVPGLQVVGIAFDDETAVKDYAVEAAFNYPILVGEAGATEAAEAFGLELMALPFTLVVTAEGELLNAHIGEIDEDEADVILDVLKALQNGELTFEQAKAKLAG
ncbi:MAG: TlpA family protein disulfide reductase [Woeseiaceae bacterium]